MTLSGHVTVLVVDDEEMVRRLAARMLLDEGYRILESPGGSEALRLLQRSSGQINGVLTDVAMPGLGGRQLGETILRCWPGIRVLYMSGYTAKRFGDEWALNPASFFIQKPFTADQLRNKMRQVLADPIIQ